MRLQRADGHTAVQKTTRKAQTPQVEHPLGNERRNAQTNLSHRSSAWTVVPNSECLSQARSFQKTASNVSPQGTTAPTSPQDVMEWPERRRHRPEQRHTNLKSCVSILIRVCFAEHNFFYDSAGKQRDIYFWRSAPFNPYPWLFVDIYGYPWILMDIHEWSMDING